MNTDPVLRTLRRAILEEPECDLHRLAYADRCEEMGDDARAEFIRVQCELARPCRPGYSYSRHVDDECAKCDRLGRRERELLVPHAETWAVAGLDGGHWGATADAKGVSLHHWDDPRYGPMMDVAVTFRRGFVEEVRITLAGFLRYVAALFAVHPITSVRLSDRKPCGQPGQAYWWYNGNHPDKAKWHKGSHHLPDGLFHGLVQGEVEGAIVSYRSRDAALAALSRVCVDHGRHLAGLPGVAISRPSLSDDTEGGEK